MKTKVLSLLVDNTSGVLSRVSGMFSRRGYNIDSLSVGVTENPKYSRMTVAVSGDDRILTQIKNQLNKLEDVVEVIELEDGASVCRELVLVKVKANQTERQSIIAITDVFRAKIVDVSVNTMTLQFADTLERFETLCDLLKPYGIREIVRTGTVAIEKDSAISRK